MVLSHEFVIQHGNSAYKSDNSNDSFVKVFRYQPVHKIYQQLIIERLMSERLTMTKKRLQNSSLLTTILCSKLSFWTWNKIKIWWQKSPYLKWNFISGYGTKFPARKFNLMAVLAPESKKYTMDLRQKTSKMTLLMNSWVKYIGK